MTDERAQLARVLGRLRLSPSTARLGRTFRDLPAALPPLECTKMTRGLLGPVARRLRASVRSGTYSPAPANRVQVRKCDGGIRTFVLLSREDHIVYSALVLGVRQEIERSLCPGSVLAGPRGTSSSHRWWAFERSVLRFSSANVLCADVADFFPNCDHRVISDALRQAGCDAEIVAGIETFLDSVMGGRRGLPNRVMSSECLSTAILSVVDREMVAAGWAYVRSGDDFRIAIDGRGPEGAIAALGQQLAELGLSLNDDKTSVVSAGQYRRRLGAESDWTGPIWDWWSTTSAAPVVHGAFGSWARLTLRRLRATPEACVAATNTIGRLLAAPPDPIAHERPIWASVELLEAAGDPAALGVLDRLVQRQPHLTSVAASYAGSLIAGAHRAPALAAVRGILAAPGGLLDSQRAWMYRATLNAGDLPPALLEDIRSSLGSPSTDWVCRVEAARVLVGRGELDEAACRELASSAPPPFSDELALLADRLRRDRREVA
jgi:hypothetical protein